VEKPMTKNVVLIVSVVDGWIYLGERVVQLAMA